MHINLTGITQKLKLFAGKINLRYILIQFIAGWFLLHSMSWFIFLFNYNYYVSLQDWANFEKHLTGNGIVKLFYFTETWIIGLLLSLVIGVLLCRRKKILSLNAVLPCILLFIIRKYGNDGWMHLRHVFLWPGSLFTSTLLFLLVNGCLLFALGMLCLFYKPLQRWWLPKGV